MDQKRDLKPYAKIISKLKLNDDKKDYPKSENSKYSQSSKINNLNVVDHIINIISNKTQQQDVFDEIGDIGDIEIDDSKYDNNENKL